MRAIIVGAGPGGATAALALARAGVRVDLIERCVWPRAKTCGDGVSPLAIRELGTLGTTVVPQVQLKRALVHTPAGTAFRGRWPDATPFGTIVEREAFDATIVDAARAAGATFTPETSVVRVQQDSAGVAVAVVGPDGAERELRADVAIVAEGAAGRLSGALGFPAYRSRVVALRGYATATVPLEPEYVLAYDRALSPGYGWIFPLGERRANLGICVDEATGARAGGVRTVLRRWLAENALVRRFFGANVALEGLRGGVIPSGRARRSNGRIFLVGDAAGVADPFTAEGIYESIRSGRLVADALADGALDGAAARYEDALQALDVNESAARALRRTFSVAIEPYARLAAVRPRFADRLMTGVFFAKPSFPRLIWNLHTGR